MTKGYHKPSGIALIWWVSMLEEEEEEESSGFRSLNQTKPIATSRVPLAKSAGRTNKPTDGGTNKAAYRVACM